MSRKKHVTVAKLRKIERELGTCSAASIARKFQVSYKIILQLAAQRHALKVAAPAHEPDKFVQLVAEISKRCFAGKLPPPEADVPLIARALEEFVPAEQPDGVRNLFAFNLARALDCTRRTQAAEWMH